MSEQPRTLTTIADLASAGLVDEARTASLERVASRFAVAVPVAMQALIVRGDEDDPIARQFVPDIRELDSHSGELTDPIGDDARTAVPGVVHRYRDRALLKIVAVCPVYCRFCFRRETIGPGQRAMLDGEDLDRALGYIADHREIGEVIMTGGDPLILSPRRIAELSARISRIAHVEKLRWHTRVPVVTPEKVNDELIDALATRSRGVRLAVHCNHPRELTPAVRGACERLAAAGFELLSQTVLLKGINDDAEILGELMRGFCATGVRPYYLHHGDLAAGTTHFRTTIAAGRAIMKELGSVLAETEQPSYVLDVPGGYGKVAICGPDVEEQRDGSYRITAADGSVHHYRDIVSS